jgi:pilus assembly protein FimV
MAKVRQLLIGLASSSALYSGLAPALGLGEITLHSALSQPLDAEIELFDVGDLTYSDMRVRLAPAEVFSRSGVDRLYFFNDLRFTPLLRGGRSVIRVVSTKPVREPYLNFIVEVARPNGQLYREYTVLLDPPSSAAYRSLAAPAVSAPPAVVTATPREATAARPAVMPVAQQGNRYSVVRGDSLWKIAARLTANVGQVGLQALMNDIHALNPQAFINGDINRLRAGVQLLLPDNLASASPAVAETPVAAAASPETVVAAPSAQLPVDPPAELLTQEQTRVEQELAGQISETLQLQQSLAQLGLQVQQMQEQMEARDQQIAGLQADLAAHQASAEATAVLVPVAATAPVTAKSGSNWLAVIAGLLALLLAGVAGLFWRSRKPIQPVPAPVAVALKPAMPKAPSVAPAAIAVAPAALVALNVREVPRGGPIWPAGGEDALQSANVYIAYGRLSEAASTLRKAWDAQPQRSDIGFRLLEVLALLGNAQDFVAHEALVRASGFAPARIDELKARHADLFSAPPAGLLDDVVLELDEDEAQPLDEAANDGQLNLDDMSLDADWDLVSPFAPNVQEKVADKAESIAAGKRETSDIFELSGSRDARSPFAESMLVEETFNDGWGGDVLDAAMLDDLDKLTGNRENLSKLNMALAYIEQGSLDSACQILNEVINEGDEEQKQEARQLLAKIA